MICRSFEECPFNRNNRLFHQSLPGSKKLIDNLAAVRVKFLRHEYMRMISHLGRLGHASTDRKICPKFGCWLLTVPRILTGNFSASHSSNAVCAPNQDRSLKTGESYPRQK